MKAGNVEALIDEIVRRRPGLTRHRVQELARERRDQIPNISEYTAVLLVAVDLGVKLSLDVPTFTQIDRLVEGLNNVKLKGRVLFVKDEKQFTRRDGRQGTYVRALIGDASGTCNVMFWDWPRKRLDDLGFIENSVVEVAQARTRLSLVGEVEVHVNATGEVREALELDDEFPALPDFLISLSEVEPGGPRAHVRGQVVSSPLIREFQREDRGPGVVARYRISDGESSTNLVLWDEAVELYRWIQPGSNIAVFNGKPKTGLSEEIEIHVGKVSHLMPISGEVVEETFPVESLKTLKEGYNMSRLYLRIDAVGVQRVSRKTKSRTLSLHVADASGEATVTFVGGGVDDLVHLRPGSVISVSGLRMRTRRDEIFLFCDESTKLERDPDVPSSVALPEASLETTRLDDVSVFHRVVNVEAQVVREPMEEEMVSGIADVRGEFYIEDGEKPARISYLGKLKSFCSDELEVGDRVRITGSLVDTASMTADAPYVPLRLRAYSKVAKVS
ncbi:MAG: hypothetical protein ACE5KH_03480 [Candidatus Geothermarchaeales archaeon]